MQNPSKLVAPERTLVVLGMMASMRRSYFSFAVFDVEVAFTYLFQVAFQARECDVVDSVEQVPHDVYTASGGSLVGLCRWFFSDGPFDGYGNGGVVCAWF